MPFVDASQTPGHDQSAAIWFRTGFVRLHGVVTKSTQLLRDRVRQDKGDCTGEGRGATCRWHARLPPVEGKTEARIESNGPCRGSEPADDDQIRMRQRGSIGVRSGSVGVRACPDPGEKQ